MIKIKNALLNENTVTALNKLIEKEIPVKTAFKITQIIKEFNPLLDTVRTAYNKILEKHSEKDEAGKPKLAVDEKGKPMPGKVVVKDQKAFVEALKELYDIESTINQEPITIDDLGAIKIEPLVLMGIDFMFKKDIAEPISKIPVEEVKK